MYYSGSGSGAGSGGGGGVNLKQLIIMTTTTMMLLIMLERRRIFSSSSSRFCTAFQVSSLTRRSSSTVSSSSASGSVRQRFQRTEHTPTYYCASSNHESSSFGRPSHHQRRTLGPAIPISCGYTTTTITTGSTRTSHLYASGSYDGDNDAGDSSSSSSSTTTSDSTATATYSDDQSAISKSRVPFRMPKNSIDDSADDDTNTKGGKSSSLSWNRLGLLTELCTCLQDELQLPGPTSVQSLVIPQLLKLMATTIDTSTDDNHQSDTMETSSSSSMAFLAATGSGKTLTYVLPLMQRLKHQEMFEDYDRSKPKRPRVLILAPTRELAIQITAVIKSLSHTVKVSTQVLVGGVDKGAQRKMLEHRPVDVVVATPGRLLQQWKDGNIFLGAVQTIVIDEMDTMLEQGFQRDLKQIMYPLLYNASTREVDNINDTNNDIKKQTHKKRNKKKNNTNNNDDDDGWTTTEGEAEEDTDTNNSTNNNNNSNNKKFGTVFQSSTILPLKEDAPQIIMTSATMTQSVQKLLGENPKTSKLSINAKRLHGNDKRHSQNKNDDDDDRNVKLKLPPMQIISTPGLHKAVPRLEQIFVDVGNTDKISLLLDVIASQHHRSTGSTIVFCNTASSVRAVQYALSESRIESFGYHGDLNSVTRTDNLNQFRTIAASAATGVGGRDSSTSSTSNILVCTDIAARGLDIPQVDNVVMFDFPLNAMDYLHRSGRTARGTGKGRVTALVSKRDKVLAKAIEQAVLRGETLDGLSSRKSDYRPGSTSASNSRSSRFGNNVSGGGKNKKYSSNKRKSFSGKKRGGKSSSSSSSSSSSFRR